ncbi:hypothetical protein XHV734_0745 [Xanthomonas hortorum pv. vitians]|nr:hypothetical protein XHV734_0745 [Xanthomonas hortorum pv. vitians]
MRGHCGIVRGGKNLAPANWHYFHQRDVVRVQQKNGAVLREASDLGALLPQRHAWPTVCDRNGPGPDQTLRRATGLPAIGRAGGSATPDALRVRRTQRALAAGSVAIKQKNAGQAGVFGATCDGSSRRLKRHCVTEAG